jgi:hypothetical protein
VLGADGIPAAEKTGVPGPRPKLRSEFLDRACGALSAASVKAVASLAKLLDSAREPIVLGAARELLASVLKVREQTEMEQRLKALEDAEAARKAEGGQWR